MFRELFCLVCFDNFFQEINKVITNGLIMGACPSFVKGNPLYSIPTLCYKYFHFRQRILTPPKLISNLAYGLVGSAHPTNNRGVIIGAYLCINSCNWFT